MENKKQIEEETKEIKGKTTKKLRNNERKKQKTNKDK